MQAQVSHTTTSRFGNVSQATSGNAEGATTPSSVEVKYVCSAHIPSYIVLLMQAPRQTRTRSAQGEQISSASTEKSIVEVCTVTYSVLCAASKRSCVCVILLG